MSVHWPDPTAFRHGGAGQIYSDLTKLCCEMQVCTKLMLETNFSQEDQDEREPLLQPGDHSFQLGQCRSRSPRLVLRAFLCMSVAVAAPSHVQQRGSALVAVMVVVGLQSVVVWPSFGTAGPFFPGGGHLNEDLTASCGGAQNQAGLKRGGCDCARRNPSQAGKKLLRRRGFRLQTLKDSTFVHTRLGGDGLIPAPSVCQKN